MGKLFRRKRRSAAEAIKHASKLEVRAEIPTDPDDPAWLRRRAEQMRLWAHKRSKSKELKAAERRKDVKAAGSLNTDGTCALG
jgi:hypothetical protein